MGTIPEAAELGDLRGSGASAREIHFTGGVQTGSVWQPFL